MNGTEAINRDFSSLKRGTRLADKILIADDEPSNRKILAQTYAARYTRCCRNCARRHARLLIYRKSAGRFIR